MSAMRSQAGRRVLAGRAIAVVARPDRGEPRPGAVEPGGDQVPDAGSSGVPAGQACNQSGLRGRRAEPGRYRVR